MVRWLYAAALIATFVALWGILVDATAKPTASPIVDATYQRQQPVEQQTPGGATQADQNLWAVNPTECAWDADDRIDIDIGGPLEAGETLSVTECIMADWADHLIGIVAVTRRVPVEVSITIPQGTFSYRDAVPAGRNGHLQEVRACVISPDYTKYSSAGIGSDNPLLPDVPGSANTEYRELAEALYTPVTWSFTNTGSHRIKDISAQAKVMLVTSSRTEFWCGTEIECVPPEPRYCWKVE